MSSIKQNVLIGLLSVLIIGVLLVSLETVGLQISKDTTKAAIGRLLER